MLVWLYTFRSGVKSLVWTDSLKTFCLITSVGLCIYFISNNLQLNLGGLIRAVKESDLSRTFFFDDMNDRRYFFKQFLGGVFTMIALTGLDQDFMQRNLSCKNAKDSQKNIITSSLMQLLINWLFLVLGVILYLFTARNGIQNPEKSDELFAMIATGGYFPIVVGILFLVGLISSAYAAAGSALTALTTSFTIDILGTEGKSEDEVRRLRKKVHFGMMAVMGFVIFIFGALNNKTVIDAVYTLASYTYGPILGMFAFGIFMKQRVRDKYIPVAAVLSPVLCYVIQQNSEKWFNGYQFSYELLLINALFTFLGLWALSKSITE
jgi:Na+/proline symporter